MMAEKSAEICRRNGWGPGTYLEADRLVIRITAVGEEDILARTVWHEGIPIAGVEQQWSLEYRAWQEVNGR
jgi:hypothetical protein